MKIGNKKELRSIAEEKSGNVDYKDFLKMYNYCTTEPYCFMTMMLDLMLLWYLGRILQNSLIKMTKSDQIKILNDKIKANNAQYNINRLNAEISAFSEGDLDKYKFLTRKDLKYKPNAPDKAKFEIFPLGKAFNQGLDKKAENYKEEGVIKLLKDIRDKMVRPICGNNDKRNNGGNNGDNGDNDDNGNNGGDNDDNEDDNKIMKIMMIMKIMKIMEMNIY